MGLGGGGGGGGRRKKKRIFVSVILSAWICFSYKNKRDYRRWQVHGKAVAIAVVVLSGAKSCVCVCVCMI